MKPENIYFGMVWIFMALVGALFCPDNFVVLLVVPTIVMLSVKYQWDDSCK